MNTYNTFAMLAKAYLESEQAPKTIKFTTSQALQTSIEGLANVAMVRYEEGNKPINVHAHEFGEMANDRLHNGEMLEPFSKMTDAFARRLYNGISNLKTIKRDVTDYTGRILKAYKEYIAADPVVAAYTGEEDRSSLGMVGLDWSPIDRISMRKVIATVHDSINYPVDGDINNAVIGMAVNSLSLKYSNKDFKPLELTDTKVKRIINKVATIVGGKATYTEITDVVKSVLFLNSVTVNGAIGLLQALTDRKYTEQINKVIGLVSRNSRVLNAISEETLDLGAVSRKQVLENIDAISDITNVAAYITIYYRDTVWRNAIVVPGPRINSDNYDEFKSHGGSVSKLVQYYNYAYKETGCPASGITTDFALASIERASAEYRQEAARQASVCEAKKKEYLRSAFINVGLEYLKTHEAFFSKSFDRNNLPKFVSAVYDSKNIEVPLESRMYDLILNSCYINSMESNIYNRLNKAYIKHATSTEALTEEMCDRIDVSVYADIVAEYLLDKGILIVK